MIDLNLKNRRFIVTFKGLQMERFKKRNVNCKT